MNDVSGERTLAGIERRVRAKGTAPEEVDRCVADELGVPSEYYAAYLQVRRVIGAHALATRAPTLTGRVLRRASDVVRTALPARRSSHPVLDRARADTDRIGWHAAAIYRTCVEGTGGPATVVDHAVHVLAAVVALHRDLDDCDGAPGGRPAHGQRRPLRTRLHVRRGGTAAAMCPREPETAARSAASRR